MLPGDVDGALASLDWYEDTYPDDGGKPYPYMTWALVLFRCGRKQAANKLCQTMFQNVYLIPMLLGQNPRPLDVSHGSNP